MHKKVLLVLFAMLMLVFLISLTGCDIAGDSESHWITPCPDISYSECCRQHFGDDYEYTGIYGGGGQPTKILCEKID